MTPQIAALRIGRSIIGVEADMDQLLVKSSQLMIEMASARAATGVEAHTLQQPMVRVANLQRSLMEARSELVRAHRDLSNLAEKMDIGFQCPDSASLEGETHAARHSAAGTLATLA
ncbi:hypothetical protein HNO88_002497 [Novosphingobium chloroacetimidivorans]|uniref:Uncharacterized protein n=1 Tax=Novosphingobium chloroacetimidivorans TaxID=1428314 RepID=A0A7W7KBL1_9SPHN|nr:hypothetical protein [Novosphingobium chloroacetimidivorans]MBB4859168.1 hypothetical protein [Novosphingobium chloroacetimidivorans]